MVSTYPGSWSVIWQGLSWQGVPEEAIKITMSSISTGTLKQYNKGLQLWWNFAQAKKQNPYVFERENILVFLTREFNKGATYNVLNTMRSAISLIIGPVVGEDSSIKRFFKGVFRLKPTKPKYNYMWNPKLVLDYFRRMEPNDQLSLKSITKKLACLLALTTAHRLQTLALIKVDNIKEDNDTLWIPIPDRIKTSAINKNQPLLTLKKYRDKRICVVETLKAYLRKTQKFRDAENSLFLTTTAPYKAASTQSISRWIKDILKEAGVNTDIFSAYTTRHASTSLACKRGLNLNLIRKTAGWSEESNTFAKFYNRPIISKDGFSNIILNS